MSDHCWRWPSRAAFVAVAALLCATPASAQNWLGFAREHTEKAFAPADAAPALPDPTMTPGAADPAVGLDRICTETTRHRRLASTKLCDAVFAAYSIPPGDRYRYECDHLVPVALGGLTVAANLWPQPNVEAERKDRLEVEMQRRACVAYRTLQPAEAAAVLAQERREIADDWTAAALIYLGADARR